MGARPGDGRWRLRRSGTLVLFTLSDDYYYVKSIRLLHFYNQLRRLNQPMTMTFTLLARLEEHLQLGHELEKSAGPNEWMGQARAWMMTLRQNRCQPR